MLTKAESIRKHAVTASVARPRRVEEAGKL
jgi:hypothetical protein